MRLFVVCLLLLTFGNLFSYEWVLYGPWNMDGYYVYIHGDADYPAIVCLDDEIAVNVEGENWTQNAIDLPIKDICPVDGDIAVVFMGNGSYSDGLYMYNITLNQMTVLEYVPYPNFMYLHEESGRYYAGHQNGMKISDNGLDWEDVTEFSGLDCRAMSASGDTMAVACTGVMRYSFNGGQDWSSLAITEEFSRISFHPNNNLYALFPGAEFWSGLYSFPADFGFINIEFWHGNVSGFAINNQDEILVGYEDTATSGGVFIWDPIGMAFTDISPGLPCIDVRNVQPYPNGGTGSVICCTSDGVYYYTEGSGVNEEKKISHVSSLGAKCSPNPFNPNTIISYTLPGSASVSINIFNSRGQLVRPLMNNKEQQAGTQSVVWDGKDSSGNTASSGVYFFVLEYDNEVVSGKMLLMK